MCSQCWTIISSLYLAFEARRVLPAVAAKGQTHSPIKRSRSKKPDTNSTANIPETLDANKSVALSKSKDDGPVVTSRNKFRIEKSNSSSMLRRLNTRMNEGSSSLIREGNNNNQSLSNNSLKRFSRDKTSDLRLQFGMKQVQLGSFEHLVQQRIISNTSKHLKSSQATSNSVRIAKSQRVEQDLGDKSVIRNTARSVLDMSGGS